MTVAIQQPLQGAWSIWEAATSQWLTWSNIWHMSDKWLMYAIYATYDQLPTRANLAWGLSSDGKCSLCEKPGTLVHVMSGCSIVLSSNRYTWCHNRVLKLKLM